MISEREEVERQTDEDAERLQKQVKVFKLLKYQDRYNDERQGKAPRYPLDIGSSLVEQSPEVPPRDRRLIQTPKLPRRINTP